MTVNMKFKVVTLTSGDMEVSGKPDISFTRIIWENGAVWTRSMPSVRKEFRYEESKQVNLLSDGQVDVIIDRINKNVDVWFLSEAMEREVIKRPVVEVNGMLKECLRSFMQEDWVLAIEVILDETLPTEAKTSTLQAVIDRQLRDPLVVALNGKINLPLIGESAEQRILLEIVGRILDSIVSRSVLGMEATGFV